MSSNDTRTIIREMAAGLSRCAFQPCLEYETPEQLAVAAEGTTAEAARMRWLDRLSGAESTRVKVQAFLETELARQLAQYDEQDEHGFDRMTDDELREMTQCCEAFGFRNPRDKSREELIRAAIQEFGKNVIPVEPAAKRQRTEH